MKLYEFGPAANAQRVRVFLSEKGIEIPSETVNLREGALHAEPYATMNPFRCVPFLELDDGTVITESLAICRYLEARHPEPALFGSTAEQSAVVEMWTRRFEIDALMPLQHAVRNHVPMFEGRVLPGTRSDLPQSAEIVERGKAMMTVFLDRVEPHFQSAVFAAGDAFSVADITGFFAIRTAGAIGMDVEASHPGVARWYSAIAARPAFQL